MQIDSFKNLGSAMGSLATLPLPGTYLSQLKDSGINERETLRNELLGCVVTQPSGSELTVEVAYHDLRDGQDDGDLFVVNYLSKTIKSLYKGWGTWSEYFGDNHHENKDYLRSGTNSF